MSKVRTIKAGNVHTGMRLYIDSQRSEPICEVHVDKPNNRVRIISKRKMMGEESFRLTEVDNINKRIEVRI